MKKKLFVISDVHGHYKEMIEALNKVGFDEDNDNHLLITLGDSFDRGRESLSIYKYLKKLSDKGKAICLMGNHTKMFIDYLDGSSITPFNYIYNGTNETLADFLHQSAPFEMWTILKNIKEPTDGDFGRWIKIARQQINEEYPELLDWLKERPYYYETTNYIFTHGAIDTKVKDWHYPHCHRYTYVDWEALIWNDGTFFGEEINNTNKTIVIGHFGTEQLRTMYHIPLQRHIGSQFDILKRDDGRVIAIDGTTALSKKVNVFVIEDEELINNDN